MAAMERVRTAVSDLADRVRHHIRFVGVRRITGGMVSAVVLLVAAWLLFAPTPPQVESVLLVTATAGANPVPSATAGTGTVRVHVAGAVRRPGVYELPSGGRVVDAVRAAGGATPSADLDAINLAQTVRDTEQVYVPSRARAAPRTSPRTAPRLRPTTTVAAAVPQSPPAAGTSGAVSGARSVNINQATASELEDLPGVGQVTARRIIAWRQTKGPFASPEDLMKVEGIGPAKFAAMKPFVSV
ncbi:MAG: putative competence protein ComEA [Actinomycetota bacterium]